MDHDSTTQRTIFDHCNGCIHFQIYIGSSEPDDPSSVSCKKNIFEYLHPECEWDDDDCKLKEIAN